MGEIEFRSRTSALVNLIKSNKVIGTRTHIEYPLQVHGDGHSFNDHSEGEEVIEEICASMYSWRERRTARRELKKIYQQTNDLSIKDLCKKGIDHPNGRITGEDIGVGVFGLSILAAVGYGVYRLVEYSINK